MMLMTDLEKEKYASFLLSYIRGQRKVKESAIAQLAIWRNKFIAHNERTETIPRIEDDEMDLLIEIATGVLQIANSYGRPVVVFDPASSGGFIKSFIRKQVVDK